VKKSVYDYLNSSLIEAEVQRAKENNLSLAAIKFKYEVDLEDAFSFKNFAKEVYKLFLYPVLCYEEKDSFILLLRDKKLHESVTLFKKNQSKIYSSLNVLIERVGITILSKNEEADEFIKRVNRYFVISKRLPTAKVIYGTKEFDFFDDKKREDSLQVVIKNNPKVQLYNIYKGIPVNNEGVVIEFNKQLMCIKTTREELLYLKRNEEFVYIKHSVFPSIIKADIFNFNFEKEYVCVKNLEFQDVSVIDRENIRIKPSKKLYITIEYQNKIVANGEILSISIDSISVKISKNSIKKVRALQKLEFDLKFKLFVKNSIAVDNLSIKGKIYKIVGDEIIFTTFPNSFIKEKIARYVSSVKQEILKSLKQQLILK